MTVIIEISKLTEKKISYPKRSNTCLLHKNQLTNVILFFFL